MELLAPAGSPETLWAVIDAGADAVYLGGDRFGARAYANNFSEDDLLEALDYAHLRGKKIYLTVNTLLKNREIGQLYDYLLPFYERGLDAVLVQDFGALVQIHEWFPDLPIHTSTQMTVTGVEGVRFLQQYGVTRVVMAREVSLAEMKKITEETGMELEAFVHGALCYSYSGQCLFSSLLGGRSGNRGRCAQPCRLPYSVYNEDKSLRKGESYVLSLKDFCCAGHLKEMSEAGVYSLKIEGRMKKTSYAAGVVAMYRKYLDAVLSGGNGSLSKEDYATLSSYGNRCGFTDGYLTRHNGTDMMTFEKPSFMQESEYDSREKSYRKIGGHLTIRHNAPMTFTVWDLSTDCRVTVSGQEPDLAQKLPVTAEDVKARMQKTKDTAFAFDFLEVELDEGLFVPNGILNQLKRDAIELLQERILLACRREAPDSTAFGASKEDAGAYTGQGVSEEQIVSLENRRLLPAVLSFDWVSTVYLDASAYDRQDFCEALLEDCRCCREKGKRVFFILPAICRAATMEFYQNNLDGLRACGLDGFVVKNYESFFFVKTNFPDRALVCDHNLYTFNDDAVRAFLQAGADTLTVPLELNRKEIAARANASSVMWVYGYYPLMTTAQCVCRNTGGCRHTPQVLYLRDRYKKDFPVRNCCPDCYNIIYNSLPTMLIAAMDELRSYGICKFRLHFSVESEQEAYHVLEDYGRALAKQPMKHFGEGAFPYTNGHYKRGVE